MVPVGHLGRQEHGVVWHMLYGRIACDASYGPVWYERSFLEQFTQRRSVSDAACPRAMRADSSVPLLETTSCISPEILLVEQDMIFGAEIRAFGGVSQSSGKSRWWNAVFTLKCQAKRSKHRRFHASQIGASKQPHYVPR